MFCALTNILVRIGIPTNIFVNQHFECYCSVCKQEKTFMKRHHGSTMVSACVRPLSVALWWNTGHWMVLGNISGMWPITSSCGVSLDAICWKNSVLQQYCLLGQSTKYSWKKIEVLWYMCFNFEFNLKHFNCFTWFSDRNSYHNIIIYIVSENWFELGHQKEEEKERD